MQLTRSRTKSTRPSSRAAGGARPTLELHLSRDVFATGRRLSGVVVFRLGRPANIHSLVVSVTGCEKPAAASVARALRRRTSFFHREFLLSGRDQPRLFSDRVSQLWNQILARDTGHRLSEGDHTYPFSITLPASLPPSYEGRAGRIDYRVAARVQYPAGGRLSIFTEVPVVFVPRAQRTRPVALSYPTADGTVHSAETRVSIELPQRSVEMGRSIAGRFRIENPQRVHIGAIDVALEMCEWVRLTQERELHRDGVDLCHVAPQDPTAPTIEGEFELRVPESGSPTIEGTAISVIWLLKLSVDTEPPIEVKTPVTVYAPVPNSG